MELRDVLVQNPIPLLFKGKKTVDRKGSDHHERSISPARMISIIIPAHNEEKYLGATLEALERQNYGWFEVVVVANGCTDATADVAHRRCQRLIVLSQKSLGVARNLGARMAKGEILVFLDADTLLNRSALKTIAREFTPGHAAGTLKGQPDRGRLHYKLVYLLKNFEHRTQLHLGSSGVIICWRENFIKTGGFDERLEVRENSELIWRLRRFGKYKYIDSAVATTSMRRYDQQGWARIVWMWTKLWFHTHFGNLHHRRYETVR
jgi:glycosyltransferase involved in cell wall biosynthesis